MLTFPRSLVRQIRILFCRALDLPRRHYDRCPVQVASGPSGISLRAQFGGYAAEYHDPIPREPEELVASAGLLYSAEGTKPDLVTLARQDESLTARWQEGAIPRFLSVTPPVIDPGLRFPDAPSNWQENSPDLWQALAAAQEATDPTASRYALGCIQLRGVGGRLAGTDGSQLFRQSGFRFGWDDEVLIPGLKLFTCAELPKDCPVFVARQQKDVILRSGNWTFWIPIREGRFPRVDDVVPSPAASCTRLSLPDREYQFVKANLPRLPCQDPSEPVTIDLNGQIAIRSRESESAPPTQLTLERAQYSGPPVCIVSKRKYLKQAIDLGFREIDFLGPEAIIVCRDGNRDFVWMPYGPQHVVKASENAIVITASQVPLSPRFMSTTRPTISAENSIESPPPEIVAVEKAPAVRTRKAKDAAVRSLIEQGQALREKLRALLHDTNELVSAAKRQKQSERLVRTTLASLKHLQAAG